MGQQLTGRPKIRRGTLKDLDELKVLADLEKPSLGFTTRGTLQGALKNRQLFVAVMGDRLVGFQHYYHRKKDTQTTLYKKMVKLEWRRIGLGKMLVDAVRDEAKELGKETLLLKCPVELPANAFHASYGFTLLRQEKGRRRQLNVWEYQLTR